MLITFGNLGKFLGIVGSITNDFLGPRAACLFASALISVGYLGVYLIASGVVPFSFPLLLFSYFCTGQGSSAAFTVSLVTNIKNWPARHRGKVVGIIISVLGFSGAIYSLIYRHVFGEQVFPFLAFLSISGLCIPLVGLVFITPRWIPKSEVVAGERQPLLNTQECQEEHLNLDHSNGESNGNIVYEAETETGPISETVTATELAQDENLEASMKEEDDDDEKMVLVHADSNPFQMIFSIDFWLYALACFTVFGSGLMVINNLGSIMLSYGAKDGDQNTPVVLLSLSGMAGRLLLGLLSDRYRRWLSRVGWMSVCALVMGCLQLAYAYIPLGAPLNAVIVGTGLSYGGMMALSPSFIGDRFGQRYLGINMSIRSVYSIAGSFIIATWLPSYIYQRNITDEQSISCDGRHCWQPTFFVCSLLCCAGFLISLLLSYRTRLMYVKKSEYGSSNIRADSSGNRLNNDNHSTNINSVDMTASVKQEGSNP